MEFLRVMTLNAVSRNPGFVRFAPSMARARARAPLAAAAASVKIVNDSRI